MVICNEELNEMKKEFDVRLNKEKTKIAEYIEKDKQHLLVYQKGKEPEITQEMLKEYSVISRSYIINKAMFKALNNLETRVNDLLGFIHGIEDKLSLIESKRELRNDDIRIYGVHSASLLSAIADLKRMYQTEFPLSVISSDIPSENFQENKVNLTWENQHKDVAINHN